ncbi:protein of unknown function [Paenibacillus alvei]|uniref:Uncharacterized protein n=1 Tax=Paenibacillus alvei TaxID=44250 RepID=A0A383RKF1_PAEAL|nr:protein of unknown function [Paenibacillus alvei]
MILGCKEVYIKVNNYLLLRIKMSHKIYGEEATWNNWASGSGSCTRLVQT